MNYHESLGVGDFCCFTSMKAIAAVTIRMSKEFPKILIAEGSSLSDRYNFLKHCELAVEASDSELSSTKTAPLDSFSAWEVNLISP